MLQLESLDLRGNEISDLNGLQSLFRLKSLYLNMNRIEDVSPLWYLINLCVLNL